MTLDNLLKIGRLHEHEPSAAEILRLLDAARRNLADARVEAISAEARFDVAYKAIMQSALVALHANGFRPTTAEGGHHAVVQQALPKTIGLASERVVVLDALRKQRNLADYTGARLGAHLVNSCIEAAEALLADVTSWLEQNAPELLQD
jgi:electron transfer flavoprotein alpha subunit